jgi:uncharacterized membrane protein HdeD (DUF308 family)
VLPALAVQWGLLLLRASIGVIFGFIALLMPELTSIGFVRLFGAYALSDGVIALIVALGARGAPGFGAPLLEASVRVGFGVLAFVSPGITALAMADVFAAWAVLSGGAAMAVAIALRRDLSSEWPLPLAGAFSLFFGLLLLWGPSPPPERQWVFGPYAILFGVTLLALTLRLRQLAYEMAADRSLVG